MYQTPLTDNNNTKTKEISVFVSSQIQRALDEPFFLELSWSRHIFLLVSKE